MGFCEAVAAAYQVVPGFLSGGGCLNRHLLTLPYEVIAGWAQDALARGCEVGCIHQPVIVNGRHPKDLPDFRWINTVFG